MIHFRVSLSQRNLSLTHSSLVFFSHYKQVDNEEDVDFMYSDTGLYSCVGVEIGGQPVGTTISHLEARGRGFNLDMYGGSMVVLESNDAINSVEDLKDKIIGAQSISDFAGAQVQFYVMFKNGLDYIMDPKQVIFTEDQEDIVRGVLDGRWDVGFVRTGQIERTLDDHGEFLDSDLFKVLEPKIYVMDNGDLFPFLVSRACCFGWIAPTRLEKNFSHSHCVNVSYLQHSTPVFPEWPLYAKQNVDRSVTEEVQVALINFEYHKIVGDRMANCKRDLCDPEGYGFPLDNCTKEVWGICETAEPVFFDPKARCDTTRELAELAYTAGIAGRHNGFRPARSHFDLRTMQQEAGFLMKNEKGTYATTATIADCISLVCKKCTALHSTARQSKPLMFLGCWLLFSFAGDWHCSRAETLYDGVICPQGHYKVAKREFDKQCDEIGLGCPEGYKCYCKPCIKAFEVDVLQWDEHDTLDNSTNSNSSISTAKQSERHVGCDKMSLCGTVRQTEKSTFRAYDNRERPGAKVRAVMHVRQESRELKVITDPDFPFIYEFSFMDNELGVGILEVFVDGVQIPESPFRVEIIERDCDLDYPGQGKDAVGTNCVCTHSLVNYCALTCGSLLLPITDSRWLLCMWPWPYRNWRRLHGHPSFCRHHCECMCSHCF